MSNRRLGSLDVLDSGNHVLVELREPKMFDGSAYRYVWGHAEHEYVGDVLFVRLGGFCSELLISPTEIVFARTLDAPPKMEGLLVLTDDHNTMLQ